MKNIQYQYLYLGGALLYFGNISVFYWKFYAIVIPFIVLDVIKNNKKK